MNPYASPILNGLESPNQEAYFAYVFDQVLTANQSVSGQVVINADADFVLRGIVVNTLTGIFQVRFNRSGLYFLSSGFIHSNNLLSDAASPLPIIPEMVFVAGPDATVWLAEPPAAADPHAPPRIPTDPAGGMLRDARVSPTHPGLAADHHPVVTLAAPMIDAEGVLLGYLGMSQRLSFWQGFFSRFSARPGRTFHLFDQQGQVVAAGLGQALRSAEELNALAREVRQDLLDQGRPVSAIYGPPDAPGRAFAAASLIEPLGWTLVV